jgi:DNA-binding NarL/FixJ family response regulator
MSVYNTVIVSDNSFFLKETEKTVKNSSNLNLIASFLKKPSEFNEILEIKPDIFIISTDYSALDAAESSAELKKRYADSDILVISYSRGENALKRLTESTASGVIIAPYKVSDLEKSVREIKKESVKSCYYPEVSFEKVSEILFKRGFNPKHSGFIFLVKIICIVSEYSQKPYITDVYSNVAKSLNTTTAAVESGARAEVRDFYKKKNEKIPELSEFIYSVLKESREDLV